jgi:hypothetical protein
MTFYEIIIFVVMLFTAGSWMLVVHTQYTVSNQPTELTKRFAMSYELSAMSYFRIQYQSACQSLSVKFPANPISTRILFSNVDRIVETHKMDGKAKSSRCKARNRPACRRPAFWAG